MNKAKILTIVKFIYFIAICLSPIVFVCILIWNLPIWVLLINIGIVLFLYILIHIIHTVTSIYVCPNCRKEFKINFIKDITAYNAKAKAKVLVCPNCGTKEVMSEKEK